MATRIQWSATERAAIAQQIRVIRAKDPGLSHPKALLCAAQMVLPMSRRRKITDGVVYALKGWVNDIRYEPIPEPAPAPVLDPIPEPPKYATSIGDLALALVREITREVMREMRAEREREEDESEKERYRDYSDRISAGIARDAERQQGRENTKLRDHMARGEFEKPRRLSVVVLGIQPAQAGVVIAAYRGRDVDFDFYDSDEAAKREVVRRDVVILMTKFISHSVQERWRPVATGGLFAGLTYCNGGVTELCAEINNILSVRGH
jgi:hypothetical protein